MRDITHVVVLKSERYGLEVFLESSEKAANEYRDDLAREYDEHGIELLAVVEVAT